MTEIVFDSEDFDFETLEQELKADEQCRRLLQQFYLWLQQQLRPEEASKLAFCADYYLRDYVLDFLRCNILKPQPGQVRYFAASWFITHTLEPESAALHQHLDAIAALYRYMQALQLISVDDLACMQSETDERGYYQQRIERFLSLAGEGYDRWNSEEPMPKITNEGATP